MRNNFSTPKGDVKYGIVISVTQLRNQYASNGGWMTARHKQYLRLFIPPYNDGGIGLAQKIAIMLPKQWALDHAPAEALAFKGLFQPTDTDAWRAAYPWIGDGDFAIDPLTIDAELGPELSQAQKYSWTAVDETPVEV